MIRRFPGLCYYCGDPVVVGAQFCPAHLWAQGIESVPAVKVSRKVLDSLRSLRPEGKR